MFFFFYYAYIYYKKIPLDIGGYIFSEKCKFNGLLP